jgi:hypothetical protein
LVDPSTREKAAPVHNIKFIHNCRTVSQYEPLEFETTLHSLKFSRADLHFDFVSLVVTVQLEQQRCFSTFNSHGNKNVREREHSLCNKTFQDFLLIFFLLLLRYLKFCTFSIVVRTKLLDRTFRAFGNLCLILQHLGQSQNLLRVSIPDYVFPAFLPFNVNTISLYSRVSYVIPFVLGLMTNSIMRFYRFWARKK